MSISGFLFDKLPNVALICTASMFVYGCSTPPKDLGFSPIRIYSSADGAVTSPEKENTRQVESDDPAETKRVEYIEGTGQFVAAATVSTGVQASADGGVSLAFKNTDIRVILKAVLADQLGISYSLDPRVQGSASLETSGAIPKDALRISLEALLRTKGYALVPSSEGYIVLPFSEAPANVNAIKHGSSVSAELPGFSVHVVSLKYTRPSELRRLLDPLSPSGGILLGDDARGILILAGTSQEVSSMMHAIETFDVDRMKGMSFGLYRLNYVDPEQIIAELTEVFQSGDQSSISPVQFIPVPRINKLIAVAPNRELLRSVERWVEKLDLGESAPGRRIYIYQVKNGRAADLAGTLNAILGTAEAGVVPNVVNAVTRSSSSRRAIRANASSSAEGAARSTLGDSGVRIVPSRENNSLVIMAAPSEFATIEAAIKKIDLAPKQVLVEVTLADVTLTDELRYGLKWHFEFGDNTVAFGSVDESEAAQDANFSWSHNNLSNVNAILSALESVTDVKVISSPKLLVLNNQSATLQVGDEVPVPTASSVSTINSNSPIVNNIEYRNTGVILTVTPRISDDGLVMIDVEQEVSNVVETASSGIDAPTIQQRRLSSTVAVPNGSTIALGGLIRSTVSRTDSGVPILKDIPLLGYAFKNGGLVERRSEMIVLLTPRIIQNAEQNREVMDYIRTEFQAVISGTPVEMAVE